MSKYLYSKQPFMTKYNKHTTRIILLVLPALFLYSKYCSADHWSASNSFTSNPASSCSGQASNFFFLAPYAARTDPSQEGGTVQDVANDGFTALGLSYQTGVNYTFELTEWLNTDRCLIHRLWPTRTVKNPLSTDYYGPAGSLVRAANEKVCPQFAAFPIDNSSALMCEEIEDASDEQMDIWVNQIEETVLQAINDPVRNNRIVAWYIGPEELRYWKAREKELLQRIYAAVKALDPLQRPAWMYNPEHSNPERLVEMGPWMDALSMGIYPHRANNDHKRIQVRHALTQMTTANALLGYSVLGFTKRVLPVLEMFENSVYPYNEEDDAAELIPVFVRHDVFAAFANGADGILIFSMGFRQGFTNYSTYYDAWADVAQQLTVLGLGDVFQHGQLQNTAIVTVTSGESEVNFKWHAFDETYPSLSVRDWLFDGTTYVLVVNSSEGEIDFQLDNITPAIYRDVFTNEQHNGANGSLQLSLPSLGVFMLKSQSPLPIIPLPFLF